MMGDTAERQSFLTQDDGVSQSEAVGFGLLSLLVVEHTPGNEGEVPRPWCDRRDAVQQAARQSGRAPKSEAQRVLYLRELNV